VTPLPRRPAVSRPTRTIPSPAGRGGPLLGAGGFLLQVHWAWGWSHLGQMPPMFSRSISRCVLPGFLGACTLPVRRQQHSTRDWLSFHVFQRPTGSAGPRTPMPAPYNPGDRRRDGTSWRSGARHGNPGMRCRRDGLDRLTWLWHGYLARGKVTTLISPPTEP
jgi:hypothetical protein